MEEQLAPLDSPSESSESARNVRKHGDDDEEEGKNPPRKNIENARPNINWKLIFIMFFANRHLRP